MYEKNTSELYLRDIAVKIRLFTASLDQKRKSLFRNNLNKRL